MNLDELERLHREATSGNWDALLHNWHTALITDDDNAKLYRNEIAPQIRQIADAKYIAALHNAFPALLALARDGERYRWLRDNTDAVNAWDRRQDGWGGGCGPDYLDGRIDAMKERT